MPGIAGVIDKSPRERGEEELHLMIREMMHETFYSSGVYTNDQLGVYAGWVCHKDSFCDCMPVFNEKKDIALVFFGETYVDKEFLDELKGRHHKFDKTNADYLVHLYEEEGTDFLRDLNGWYSGILIDLQKNRVIVFNDRYGMQKIFYYEGKDAFYFASEAKALLTICPELRVLDMQGAAELITCACVLENRTLFAHIYLMPYASAWIFRSGDAIEKTQYFSPDVWENQPWLEKDYFYHKLRETFVRILPRYFRGSQKIGISLTGGVDSRMIMANIDLPPAKYPCYTFGGPYRDSFDVTISRKVAVAAGQTHETIRVDRAFLDNFSKWAEKTVFVTDGYLDVSGSSEIYINSLARNIAPVRLTGNFGGEILRNIRHLKASPPLHALFDQDFYGYTERTKDIIDKCRKEPLSMVLFYDCPWYSNNRLVSEQSQLILRTPYLDNDLVALMYRLQTHIRRSKEMSLRLIADGNRALSEIVTDKGLSCKTIFPLSALTHLWYEFLAKAEYAYDYGMPKWLSRLDYAFRSMHLERLFLGRHKFNHFHLWYRNELADYVKQILLDRRTLSRPYLNKKLVVQAVENHINGRMNYTDEISQLLTLELIQRVLIEKDS